MGEPGYTRGQQTVGEPGYTRGQQTVGEPELALVYTWTADCGASLS